jgi:hypothetical protein
MCIFELIGIENSHLRSGWNILYRTPNGGYWNTI